MVGFGKLAGASVVMVVFGAACGGGGSVDDLIDGNADTTDEGAGADDPGDAVFGDIGDAAEGGAGGNLEVVDAPTVTADPGHIVVDVDGRQLVYPLVGSTHPMCDVTPETIQVNVQQTEAGDFSLVATPRDGVWLGSITFSPQGTTDSYGADFQSGRLGIGDNAVSYDGPINKVVDFDIVNAETVEGTVAINCDSPGGDPTAEVGDQSYTFPLSGAQGIDCTVAPEEFEVRINRLSLDGTQLEMQGRGGPDQWVGAVVVYTAEGNSIAQLAPDGSGLVIDGGTVGFDGTFTMPDGTEVTGSATATCFQ
jgi:hypothetical protein